MRTEKLLRGVVIGFWPVCFFLLALIIPYLSHDVFSASILIMLAVGSIIGELWIIWLEQYVRERLEEEKTNTV